MEILASSVPDEKRLLALKYFVHLVGDVHQPLHAGYAEDRGGNTYQLQAFVAGSNLHALWDSGLIRSLSQTSEALTARLNAAPIVVGSLSPSQMAEESCKIVRTPGFYPQRKVGADYLERFIPIMEQRLALAGARLAAMLNRAFQ